MKTACFKVFDINSSAGAAKTICKLPASQSEIFAKYSLRDFCSTLALIVRKGQRGVCLTAIASYDVYYAG